MNAALKRAQRPGLEAVLRILDDLDGELLETVLSSSELFLPILRQNVRDKDKRLRSNICSFLVSMSDTRVAYLLADLLQDPVEDIKKKAQEGLIDLAHNYYVAAFDPGDDTAETSRRGEETKRYALLDALLTALRFYSSHERPEMIAALFSLDRRGDEVLMDILANPMDRRRKIILDILETATYSRAIEFLLTMLKSRKTAAQVEEIIETRFDTPFIKALLSNRSLFSNRKTTEALSNIEFVPWMRPGTQKIDEVEDVLAVRAVRFLLFTGTEDTEKRAILERLTRCERVPVASAARFVLAAMERRVDADRIDAGLVKIQQGCGVWDEPPSEPETDELVADRSAPKKDTSGLLSDQARFRNFMNSFESLARSQKISIMEEFDAKGVLAPEVKRALSEVDAEITLRAIKVVEYGGRQTQFASELAVLTKHPDTRVRSSAVRQLGKTGAYDALKALFQTLTDRDRRVLANAVEALEETGHKQIIRLLEPLMRHPDNRVRANAAKAAWTLGNERGREVLVEMLSSPKPETRLSALWGLRQIGIRKESLQVREMVKNDSDERVRNSAEMTLVTWENAE